MHLLITSVYQKNLITISFVTNLFMALLLLFLKSIRPHTKLFRLSHETDYRFLHCLYYPLFLQSTFIFSEWTVPSTGAIRTWRLLCGLTTSSSITVSTVSAPPISTWFWCVDKVSQWLCCSYVLQLLNR
jgi:hypothetical protein